MSQIGQGQVRKSRGPGPPLAGSRSGDIPLTLQTHIKVSKIEISLKGGFHVL